MLHDAMTIRLSNQGEREALQEMASFAKSLVQPTSHAIRHGHGGQLMAIYRLQ